MEKKELVMEIIGLYDEVARLQEENKILKVQQRLTNIKGEQVIIEESKAEDDPRIILQNFIRKSYFNREYRYRVEDVSVVFNDSEADADAEDGEDKKADKPFIKSFDRRFSNINVNRMLGYNTEILAIVSLKDLKQFFMPELKELYKELVRKATEPEKLEEKEGRTATITVGSTEYTLSSE